MPLTRHALYPNTSTTPIQYNVVPGVLMKVKRTANLGNYWSFEYHNPPHIFGIVWAKTHSYKCQHIPF